MQVVPRILRPVLYRTLLFFGKETDMNLEEVYGIKDEIEQIKKTYEIFDENRRLSRCKAARVEFLTNIRYIEKYLKPGDRILDIGAGAGEYSLYFANAGYKVDALELSERNISDFPQKMKAEHQINLVQGNAVDLSRYQNASFDIVLVFGPLYHLHSESDKLKCISEAKRVCKPDGKLFFSFITNDMVILTEFSYRSDFFLNGKYDKSTFQLEDFPFVFHTLASCRTLLSKGGVKPIHEVASDGISELMEEKINAMDTESYEQYLKYHYYICEKKEFLGMTNHLLFVSDNR